MRNLRQDYLIVMKHRAASDSIDNVFSLRSLELKLLSGRENQEEEIKTKQQLTDKVRKMAREMKVKQK